MAEDDSSSTHPPLPPTTEGDRFDRLRLLRSRRVGPTTFRRLLAEYGTARAALEALPDVARAAGVDDYRPCPPEIVERELAAGRRLGATLLLQGDAAFPTALSDLEDAPPALWCLGATDLLNRPCIALVGARNASSLGTADLGAAGFVVVSGLARGIDAIAHDTALATGTIAVQAGGVDVIYPTDNTELAQRIARDGLRLSEQPIGLQPQARHFPARNRIISGLARAVVVVEAAARSGSLITARSALDQGREVLAVPGHPFDARAAGCNHLIRDGATLVRNAEDVIAALGAEPARSPELPLSQPAPPTAQGPAAQAPAVPPRSLRDTAALHREILSRLGPTPMAEDQLIRDLRVAPVALGAALVDLELDGTIRRQPGGLLARVV